MRVETWSPAASDDWDAFVARCPQGTFLHTRRFLGYHGDRFADRSLIVRGPRAEIVGLFPAALDRADPQCIRSHPGATYGGLLFEADASPGEVLDMMRAVADWGASIGARALRVDAVPWPVRRSPCEADLYALAQLGARLERRDLWNVIDLAQSRRSRASHRWRMRQAAGSDVVVSPEGVAGLAEFHQLLSAGLEARHGVTPVHSQDELHDLHHRLGADVQLWAGRDAGGRLVAGAWLFKLHEGCWHTQYLTVSDEGRRCGALHLLVERLIEEATAAGVRHFSFGRSTSGDDAELNESLHEFKSGFGHGLVCQDAYLLDLARRPR